MKRRLSSGLTFIVKAVHPAITISVMIFLSIAIFVVPDKRGILLVMQWIFPIILILIVLQLYRICIPLKRISMDQEALYVSNYIKQIRVSLRDVKSVHEKRLFNIHHIEIEFRHDTEFGKHVVFMPNMRWFDSRSPHPEVAEIQAAVARANGITGVFPAT